MSVSAGDQFNISLYDIHVELKCIPFVEGTPPTGMEQMNAYDVATRPVVTMEHVVPVKTVVEVLQTKTHNGFPVITPNNKFVGTILRSQLVVLLRNESGKCWVESPDGYTDPPAEGPLSDHYGATIDDFGTRLQSDTPGVESLELDMGKLDGKYLDLRPFMNPVRACVVQLPFSGLGLFRPHPHLYLYTSWGWLVGWLDFALLWPAYASPPNCSELTRAALISGAVFGHGRHATDASLPAVSGDGNPSLDSHQHRQRGAASVCPCPILMPLPGAAAPLELLANGAACSWLLWHQVVGILTRKELRTDFKTDLY